MAEDDRRSVFTPEVNSYPGQSEFHYTDFYRVDRIVGKGTLENYTLSGPRDGMLATLQEGVVLSPNACVGFKVTIIVPKEYYFYVKSVFQYNSTVLPLSIAGGFTAGPVPLQFRDGLIYQGDSPIGLPIRVDVFFNGIPIRSLLKNGADSGF